MSPSKLGVFATLALAASAVLIPPTITADDLGDDHAMEGLVIDPYKRSAVLECADCLHALRDGEYITWERNAGSAYQVDFEIGTGGDTVEVDSVQLYPPSFDAAATSFYVTQVDSDIKEPLRLRVTGYTFSFTGAETVTQEGTELLPMTLRIASVEGVTVQLPALQINVLKDAHGNMMIASFDIAKPIEPVPGAPEDCNKWPLLCKWRKITAERIEQMKKKMGKGCHRGPHGYHNPMAEDTIEGKPPHRFHAGDPHRHPHHRPHHMGHHGHGHHHRMHMFARRAFFTILVPIIIGIFAGTVTYLIGMVLGTFIAIIIAKIRGQEYQRIALEDDVEEAQPEVQSEKEGYAELPAYDAPPVYEEASDKEVDESK